MEAFSPKKQDKEVISIRISTKLLKEVDSQSAKADISRNEFINQCIEFALAHIKK
ncbi:MAG: ribbon-helix-helix protein, CopG family [Clostridia bacterium]|nr:ribbon-helix-helix protein, CopG family [Clostridia bacterium]